MSSRGELPGIREVEILSDQESSLGLGRAPDLLIVASSEAFIEHGVRVMPQAPEVGGKGERKVFVELDLQRTAGTPRVGRSSKAEAAANAMMARMLSSEREGKS